MNAEINAQARLTGWSNLNAILLLAAAGIGLLFLNIPVASFSAPSFPIALVLIALSVLASFALLLYRMRFHWTSDGGFGPANAVTLSRLLGVVLLFRFHGSIPGAAIAFCVFVFLALDGLDGILARRSGRASLFGSVFDMETDAVTTYLLCFAAVWSGRLHPALLLIGLIRYIFVLFRLVVRRPVFARMGAAARSLREDSPSGGERRGTFGRLVHGMTICALACAFLPWPNLRTPPAAAALVLLCISFAPDFRDAWRKRGM